MTHPAILKVQSFHGLPRDLTPDEQDLAHAVDEIGWAKCRAYQTINFVWGDLPRQYRAELTKADKIASDDLTIALSDYEDSLEDHELELAAE